MSLVNSSSRRNFSRSTQPLHEHEEDEVGFQEVNLKSPLTPNTIVNLKVSVCNASISNSLERGGHLTLGIPTGVGVPVDNDSILVNGRTSPQQTYHVTEVVTNETDATSIVTLAPDDSEHDLSLTMEESEYVRKCSSWFCRQGKSPFEAILLIFCYLMIVVLFFPIFVVIMLVCFVSYFTPDIDDWLIASILISQV